jgi:hypothetical protein
LSEEDLIKKIATVHAIGVRSHLLPFLNFLFSHIILSFPHFFLFLCRSKTKLTKKVLEHAKKLLAVGCFCIGTDQTDLDYAASNGTVVFNSPYANTRSVAEMIIGYLVVLARQLSDRNMEVHKGIWNKVGIAVFVFLLLAFLCRILTCLLSFRLPSFFFLFLLL